MNYISQRVNSNALDSHWCAIYFDEQLTGVIGIKGVDSHTRVTEIGYWLANNGRGHRVIDQVLAVLIPFLKKKGHAQFIQSIVWKITSLASILLSVQAPH